MHINSLSIFVIVLDLKFERPLMAGGNPIILCILIYEGSVWKKVKSAIVDSDFLQELHKNAYLKKIHINLSFIISYI